MKIIQKAQCFRMLIPISLIIIIITSSCARKEGLGNKKYYLSEAIDNNGRSIWYVVNDGSGNPVEKDRLVKEIYVFEKGKVTAYDLFYDEDPYRQYGCFIRLGDLATMGDEEVIETAKKIEEDRFNCEIEDVKYGLEYFYTKEILDPTIPDYNEKLESFDISAPYCSDYFYNYNKLKDIRKKMEDFIEAEKITSEYAYKINTDGTGNNTDQEVIQLEKPNGLKDWRTTTINFIPQMIKGKLYDNYYIGMYCEDNPDSYESIVENMAERLFQAGMDTDEFYFGVEEEKEDCPFWGRDFVITKCSEETELTLDEPDMEKFIVDDKKPKNTPKWVD